jgi:hypothetical protein
MEERGFGTFWAAGHLEAFFIRRCHRPEHISRITSPNQFKDTTKVGLQDGGGTMNSLFSPTCTATDRNLSQGRHSSCPCQLALVGPRTKLTGH